MKAKGLSNRQLGSMVGVETNTLSITQMLSHSHTVKAVSVIGNQNSPIGNFPANSGFIDNEYSNMSVDTTMNSSMISDTGGGYSVNNVEPFTTIRDRCMELYNLIYFVYFLY